jgi:anthranilate phosphoribosyltransferase
MIKEAILKVTNKEDIGYEMAKQVMDEIMSGETSQIQISSFLTAMSMKGETIEEITGCAEGMRAHCKKLLDNENVLEIVGTGGDGSSSINLSTIASIIVSAVGIKVAKHGNRAASSKCGAADVLEALGVKLAIEPDKNAEILNKIGICFLFAQNYHMSMKYVAPVRKELGIRTIFNILGPLTNPAGANMQLLGVYDESLVEPLAKVLYNLGVKNAMVVYGQDRIDEISMSAPTTVCEVRNGEYNNYVIKPEDFGFVRCKKEDIEGGTPEENAKYAMEILKGAKGPKTDAVLINAGAAIHVAKPEVSISEGINIAREMIESGKALKQLEEFVRLTNED